MKKTLTHKWKKKNKKMKGNKTIKKEGKATKKKNAKDEIKKNNNTKKRRPLTRNDNNEYLLFNAIHFNPGELRSRC